MSSLKFHFSVIQPINYFPRGIYLQNATVCWFVKVISSANHRNG
jgi:hypothetical protein